jgi:hypothetical protein
MPSLPIEAQLDQQPYPALPEIKDNIKTTL